MPNIDPRFNGELIVSISLSLPLLACNDDVLHLDDPFPHHAVFLHVTLISLRRTHYPNNNVHGLTSTCILHG